MVFLGRFYYKYIFPFLQENLEEQDAVQGK
jgi:hypothetical protein